MIALWNVRRVAAQPLHTWPETQGESRLQEEHLKTQTAALYCSDPFPLQAY